MTAHQRRGDAAQRVADYYDDRTELFLEEFGPVFQAGALRDGHDAGHEASVRALASQAGIADGDRVLDAGCGVGGPAAIIASAHPHVTIHGVTVSARQVELGEALLEERGLADRVRLHHADYHMLPFRDGSFDVAIFFESTGYARDLESLYGEAFRVVRPGGRVYVKDVFRRSEELTAEESADMQAFDELWGCVESPTLDATADAMRRAGFERIEAQELAGVTTVELRRRMWTLDPDRGVVLSRLGEGFYRPDLSPPTIFGEVRAVRSG